MATCDQPGCDQEIWYEPDKHDTCAGCRQRGGPPPERVETPRETDADRVRRYLADKTPDQRRHLIRVLLGQGQPAMAALWAKITTELECATD